MKSFAVVFVVAAMSLYGCFIPTLAVVTKCNICLEADVKTCGQSATLTPGACATKCFEVHVEDATSKALGILRGCAVAGEADCNKALLAASTNKLVKGTCKYCEDKDNCNSMIYGAPGSPGAGNATESVNGHPSFTGSAVHCVLVSSLVVARMFFQTV